MADPLSAIGILANVAAVATAGIQLSQSLYEISKRLINAPKEVAEVAGEIALLSGIIGHLGDVLNEAKKLCKPELLQNAKEILDRFGNLQNDIKDIIRKIHGFERLKYAFGFSNLPLLMAKVNALKSFVLLVVSTVQLSVTTSKDKRYVSLAAYASPEFSNQPRSPRRKKAPKVEKIEPRHRQLAETYVNANREAIRELRSQAANEKKIATQPKMSARTADALTFTHWSESQDQVAAWLHFRIFDRTQQSSNSHLRRRPRNGYAETVKTQKADASASESEDDAPKSSAVEKATSSDPNEPPPTISQEQEHDLYTSVDPRQTVNELLQIWTKLSEAQLYDPWAPVELEANHDWKAAVNALIKSCFKDDEMAGRSWHRNVKPTDDVAAETGNVVHDDGQNSHQPNLTDNPKQKDNEFRMAFNPAAGFELNFEDSPGRRHVTVTPKGDNTAELLIATNKETQQRGANTDKTQEHAERTNQQLEGQGDENQASSSFSGKVKAAAYGSELFRDVTAQAEAESEEAYQRAQAQKRMNENSDARESRARLNAAKAYQESLKKTSMDERTAVSVNRTAVVDSVKGEPSNSRAIWTASTDAFMVPGEAATATNAYHYPGGVRGSSNTDTNKRATASKRLSKFDRGNKYMMDTGSEEEEEEEEETSEPDEDLASESWEEVRPEDSLSQMPRMPSRSSLQKGGQRLSARLSNSRTRFSLPEHPKSTAYPGSRSTASDGNEGQSTKQYLSGSLPPPRSSPASHIYDGNPFASTYTPQSTPLPSLPPPPSTYSTTYGPLTRYGSSPYFAPLPPNDHEVLRIDQELRFQKKLSEEKDLAFQTAQLEANQKIAVAEAAREKAEAAAQQRAKLAEVAFRKAAAEERRRIEEVEAAHKMLEEEQNKERTSRKLEQLEDLIKRHEDDRRMREQAFEAGRQKVAAEAAERLELALENSRREAAQRADADIKRLEMDYEKRLSAVRDEVNFVKKHAEETKEMLATTQSELARQIEEASRLQKAELNPLRYQMTEEKARRGPDSNDDDDDDDDDDDGETTTSVNEATTTHQTTAEHSRQLTEIQYDGGCSQSRPEVIMFSDGPGWDDEEKTELGQSLGRFGFKPYFAQSVPDMTFQHDHIQQRLGSSGCQTTAAVFTKPTRSPTVSELYRSLKVCGWRPLYARATSFGQTWFLGCQPIHINMFEPGSYVPQMGPSRNRESRSQSPPNDEHLMIGKEWIDDEALKMSGFQYQIHKSGHVLLSPELTSVRSPTTPRFASQPLTDGTARC
jgi:hypothetical protein